MTAALPILVYEYSYARNCGMAQQRKTGRRKVSNLMALSLLSLLTVRPMYPYEMA